MLVPLLVLPMAFTKLRHQIKWWQKSKMVLCVRGQQRISKITVRRKKRGLGEWDGRASEWKRAEYFYKSEIVSNIRGWRCFPQNRKGRVMSEFVSVSDFNATEIGRHLFVPHFSASHLNHTIFSSACTPFALFLEYFLFPIHSSIAHSLF